MFLTSRHKITEDDYNRLLQCSRVEISDFVSEIANDSPYPPCAYGFSSPKVFKELGDYFVSWEHWSSCD